MGRLRPRQAWGLGVLVAGAALVALVAVAADGAPLRAPTDSGRSSLSDRLLAGLEVAVLVAGGLLLVALIVMAITSGRNRRPQASGRRALMRTVMAMVAMAVLATAFLHRRQDDQRDEQPAQPAPTAAASDDGSAEGTRPTWPLFLLGGAVVVALGAAAWAGRRRQPFPDDDVDATTAATARRVAAGTAFTASLADLEAEPDPRRAIVTAYARLLDGLAAAGFARRPAEAPEEHLRRVLEQLLVPDAPLRTLVALFAEARFSEHPLTSVHKQAAIDAFRAARDALAPLATAGDARP